MASPGAAPLPTTDKEIPSRPVSDSPSSADQNINDPLTSIPLLPEPPDNPTPPSPDHPTNDNQHANPLPPVIPSALPLHQASTNSSQPLPDPTPHYQSTATYPEEIVAPTASINSLSPLSDVPSAPSPSHALESPTNQSSHHPPLHCPSTASFKRQPSPSMYESETSMIRQSEDSPNHLNGSRTESNGQSALKRPRLDSDSSTNPQMNLSKTSSDIPQASSNPYPSAPSFPTGPTDPIQSITETTGFVPGTSGTRLTKDQHRFAVSVTKQLKKHRSAGPFLTPVDPVTLNIPDYYNVVKQPMDLLTIETRLGKAGKPCHYRSVEEFVADVQQVFSNCYMYNGPPATSPYSRMALDLSIQFETQMKKMPLDEPMSHASTSRSPSLAKPALKSKQTSDIRPPAPALKRKNGSVSVNAPSIQAGPNGSQKRRSASPQHPRKKGTKATSASAAATPDSNLINLNTAPRTSINDPSSSHRPNAQIWNQSTRVGADHASNQMSTEQPMVSNAEAELKFCHNLLREVNKKIYSKFVWPFYEPVDIVKLGIPEYPKYVKKPMDLQTMKMKLKNKEYPNGAAFADDFRLMLDNCFAFNPSGTYRECGQQLERLFEGKWTERPPEEIPAPAPPPVASVSTTAGQLDSIQQLQMQVAQLQERLNVVHASNSGLARGHMVPGTGPPKKHSISRAPAASKSSPNLNNSGLVLPPSTLSNASKGKANGAGVTKPKQTHGGARRKSTAATLTPSAKRQTQTAEQLPLSGQSDHPEMAREPYQRLSSTGATLPSAPPSAACKNSLGSEYYEIIDYEQKKDLATQIQNAVEPMQSDAINLIRNSRPDLVAADGEEIELDIDALDNRTLYQLYQLVCTPLLPPTKPKKPKAAAANGKIKGGRKGGPGAGRKSMPTAMPSFPAPVLASVGPHTEMAPISPYPSAQVANGHHNGTKSKPKKPRASVPGPPKRKGIDESQVAARIKDLEEKLNDFSGLTNSQQQPLNHSNGVPSTNPASGPNSSAPPVGPVEYASSSSESESDSDDDSD